MAKRRRTPEEMQLIMLYKNSLGQVRSDLAVAYEKYSVADKLSMNEMQKYRRLAALEKNIARELKNLGIAQKALITKHIKGAFSGSYYYKGFQLEQATRMNLGFGMLNPKVIKAAVDNPYDRIKWPNRALNHIKLMNDQVRQTIATGLIQGHSYPKVARELKKRMDVGATKAKRIINTEMHRAQVQGKLDAFDTAQNDVGSAFEIDRAWDAAIDSVTRDQHASFDGSLADKKNVFTLPDGTRGRGPGLTGVAKHDINCRCSVREELLGFEPSKRRVRDHGVVEYKTYKQWAKAKGVPQLIKIPPKTPKGKKIAKAFIAAATIDQAVEFTKGLGVEWVHFGKKLHMANRVNEGLADWKAKGLPMPKFIDSRSELFASKWVPAKYYGNKDVLMLNPSANAWLKKNAKQDIAKEAYYKGQWSTPNKHHIVRHELGHMAHAKDIGLERYERIRNRTFPDFQKSVIKVEVSDYAAKNPYEFVAEVHTGMIDGKKYSEQIMNWYNIYNGPKL